MAPVCVAYLLLPLLFSLVLLVTLLTIYVNSLLVYNRQTQTLLDLGFQTKDLEKLNCGGHKTLLPFLSEIPAHLCCTLARPPRRKPTRRRGRCSGQLVRLKACLAHFSSALPCLSIYHRLPWLHLPTDACMIPVVGSDQGPHV